MNKLQIEVLDLINKLPEGKRSRPLISVLIEEVRHPKTFARLRYLKSLLQRMCNEK